MSTFRSTKPQQSGDSGKQDSIPLTQYSISESGNSRTNSSTSKKGDSSGYEFGPAYAGETRGNTTWDGTAENFADPSFEDTVGDNSTLSSKKPSVRYASLPQIPKSKTARGGLAYIPSGGSTPSLESAPPSRSHSPSIPAVSMPASSRPSSVTGTEDENSEEEDYDWSTDEDILDEETKQTPSKSSDKKTMFTLKRVFVFFLSTLVGSTILSALLSTIPIFLHFFYLKAHPTNHRHYITDNVSAWFVWLAANTLMTWYLAAIVDLIPLLLPFVIYMVWGVVSESVISRIEIYNAVKSRFKPVLYAAFAWGSWVIIFGGIYGLYNHREPTNSFAGYTRRVGSFARPYSPSIHSCVRHTRRSNSFSFSRSSFPSKRFCHTG